MHPVAVTDVGLGRRRHHKFIRFFRILDPEHTTGLIPSLIPRRPDSRTQKGIGATPGNFWARVGVSFQETAL